MPTPPRLHPAHRQDLASPHSHARSGPAVVGPGCIPGPRHPVSCSALAGAPGPALPAYPRKAHDTRRHPLPDRTATHPLQAPELATIRHAAAAPGELGPGAVRRRHPQRHLRPRGPAGNGPGTGPRHPSGQPRTASGQRRRTQLAVTVRLPVHSQWRRLYRQFLLQPVPARPPAPRGFPRPGGPGRPRRLPGPALRTTGAHQHRRRLRRAPGGPGAYGLAAGKRSLPDSHRRRRHAVCPGHDLAQLVVAARHARPADRAGAQLAQPVPGAEPKQPLALAADGRVALRPALRRGLLAGDSPGRPGPAAAPGQRGLPQPAGAGRRPVAGWRPGR